MSYFKGQIERILEIFRNYYAQKGEAGMPNSVGSFLVNPKVCELLSKMTGEKIISMYNVSRDIFALMKWTEYFEKDFAVERNLVKDTFIQSFSIFLHITFEYN